MDRKEYMRKYMERYRGKFTDEEKLLRKFQHIYDDKFLKPKVLKETNGHCELCNGIIGINGELTNKKTREIKSFHLHHIKYMKTPNDLLIGERSNVLLLCGSCHYKLHRKSINERFPDIKTYIMMKKLSDKYKECLQ